LNSTLPFKDELLDIIKFLTSLSPRLRKLIYFRHEFVLERELRFQLIHRYEW